MAMAEVLRSRSLLTESVRGQCRVEVRPLDWETGFFGARMGMIVHTSRFDEAGLVEQSNVLAREIRGVMRQAELEGYRHLSYRVSADDLPAIWAAERAELRLMDVAVDLGFNFESTPPPVVNGDRPTRLATPDDLPALEAMTQGAFSLTRFAVDPFFANAQVDHFYQTWTRNLFVGLADVVLVTDIDGQPAGFVSCKLGGHGEGRIPLVATAAACRRRGVAGDLVSAALAWFAEASLTRAYVKTQAANTAAVALYERAGFTLSRSELTFTTTFN